MKALHYAWIIVVCAFLGLLISNGLAIGGLPVFDKAILSEFGWTRDSYKLGAFLTFAIAGLCGPFIGGFADRHGVRRLMLIGSVLLAGGLFGYSQIQNKLHLYLVHSVFGVALACVGLVVCVMLVSRWFTAKRGTAIGLALVGTSMGTVMFSKVNTWIILSVGWREAFQWLSLFPLLLIPVILLFIREWPRDRGITAYGSPVASAPGDARARDGDDNEGERSGEAPGAAVTGVSYAEAVRSRDFWALALIAMTTFYVVLAVAQHLFLHLTGSFSFTPQKASSGLALFGVTALAGKFLLGFLSDYFVPRRVLIAGLLVMLAGCLCLTAMSESLLWPAVLLFGLGWGGLYTMIQLLIVVRFGLKDSGRILGTITILDALGGGLGPYLTGLFYEISDKSYQTSFIVMSGLLVGALLLATLVLRGTAPTASEDVSVPTARVVDK